MEFNHSSYTDRLIALNRLLPLELAAREAECTRQQMVARISRMEVIGVRVNGHWYVERPLTAYCSRIPTITPQPSCDSTSAASANSCSQAAASYCYQYDPTTQISTMPLRP